MTYYNSHRAYISIDPSYSRTGVCVYVPSKKKFIFKAISPEGTNETYPKAILRADNIAEEVLKVLSGYNEVNVIIEEPMVTSLMASRLGILSGVLAKTLFSYSNVKQISTVNPNTLRSLNSALPEKVKKGLNPKELSRHTADNILDFLTENNYTVEILNDKLKKDGTPKVRKVSHDELEAFLLLILLLKESNELNQNEWLGILNVNKGFYQKNIQLNKLK